MKVLTMIDSFKGTITSSELGKITKDVLESKNISCDYIPISDGGDGFLECIEKVITCKKVEMTVNNPFFSKINSYYLIDQKENTAYIEMALASGINLIKEKDLNPFLASTYGTGELILDAINKKCKKIIVGIGGSATNDGGSGMLEALGIKFYNNDFLLSQMNCEKIGKVTHIDTKTFFENTKNISFKALNDVKNPLLGKSGATYIFSKQKGAKENDFPLLEKYMKNYSDVCKKEFNVDNSMYSGSGAAGGMGFALKTFMKAEFIQGTKYILDLMNYEKFIENYDYIITGEGKIDIQSLSGKVVFSIKQRSLNKKVILVCAINELDLTKIKEYGIYKIYSIVPNIATREESLNNPIESYKKLCKTIELFK